MTHKIRVFLIIYVAVCMMTYGVLRYFFAKPMFSIIISVYNYEKYLPDAIQSVLNSTEKDFELIIVNDGSTDRSLQIMRNFAEKDTRIQVINQENQGLSIARNNAMKKARGSYFWFVDADDWIDEEALKKLKYAILKTKQKTDLEPDIVSFYIQPVASDKSFLDKGGYDLLPSSLLKYKTTPYQGDKLPVGVLLQIPVTSGKQIYRRSYIEEKGIIFPPHLYFEDECFFMATLLGGANGIIIPEALYYKRDHWGSIVHNRHKYYDSTVRLAKVAYEYVKRVGADKEKSQQIFDWYYGGIFVKWPNDPKYIPVLKELLAFIEQEFPNDFGWMRADRLRQFITEKEQNFQKEK